MPHEKNMKTALSGYLNIGDGEDISKINTSGRGNSKSDETANIRDILSGVIGKGYTSFSDPDVQHNFAVLSSIVGKQQAQQLFSHAFIFNQRPDIQGKNPLERITQFYDTGSSNPEINTTIQAAKMFGRGPQSGVNESSDVMNRQIAGRYDLAGTGGSDKDKIQELAAKTIK